MYRIFEYFLASYKEPEIVNLINTELEVNKLLIAIDQVIESLKEKVE